MIYKFRQDPVSKIILVSVELDDMHEFEMVLDTAASITTFDINPLRMAYYPIDKIIEQTMVETASGKMDVDIIQTKAISAFGHTVHGMKVQMYDFLKHGILSDYDGLLGLDFFKNTVFTINMDEQTIKVKSKKSKRYEQNPL